MSPSIAGLLIAFGIAGLFYLNRDTSARTSAALWIAVIWFWILGSRTVSAWLGVGPGEGAATAAQLMEGSPTDALVFQLLIAGGLAVLVLRGRRCGPLIKANWPIIAYFSYCLISVAWSDYPDISAKRWIKSTGDVVMALVVVTDAQPAAAMRRLFSRVGFVLVPTSTLLIKYYPYLGRTYDRWTGQLYNTGVTTDKNILGVTTYILALGALWQVLRLYKESSLPNRLRQLIAQGTLLGFAIWNLGTADSATSKTCLILGTFLMLVSRLKRFRGRPLALERMILAMIAFGGVIKLTGADAMVFAALGRNPDLTGRVGIWPFLISMAPNPLLGAGFESFWLGPRLHQIWTHFSGIYLNEAHNGYLEVYLELGMIGVILVSLILIHGYRRALAAFRIDPDMGSLTLAGVLAAPLYSYTEAGFRNLDYSWGFLILFIAAAVSISRTRRPGVKPATSEDAEHSFREPVRPAEQETRWPSPECAAQAPRHATPP